MSVRPLFIFSLPRSGSTLLQRIINESPEVGTTSEPWILLPFFGTERSFGTHTDYGFYNAKKGLASFKDALDKPGAFKDELRSFILRLYSRAAPEEVTYFLDKTPRYHLICSRILDLFPDARAIILWRNPLSVAASMMQTWASGRWNLYRYQLDLYKGLERLVDLAKQQRANVVTTSYETLVTEPNAVRSQISDFLQIDIDGSDEAPAVIEGNLGDPTQRRYKEISKDPLSKWKKTLNNPFRKVLMRRYLEWIGHERLQIMGYDLEALKAELKAVPATSDYLITDIVRWLYGKLQRGLEIELFQEKIRQYEREDYVVGHR